MKKVVKFGGSSLASAGQFQKVGDIIRADRDSYAMWYRPRRENVSNGDTKVTDMLYRCYYSAANRTRISVASSMQIKARYQ